MGDKTSPVKIAEEAIKFANLKGYDMVFIDTAGRLHIDEAMMEELRQIKAKTNPTEILLTVDAMIGQDAVNVAKTFNDLLDITGVILTKLDGDTRGGAALSVSVTGKPIKFIGVGESAQLIHRTAWHSGFSEWRCSRLSKRRNRPTTKNRRNLKENQRINDAKLPRSVAQIKKMGNFDQARHDAGRKKPQGH